VLLAGQQRGLIASKDHHAEKCSLQHEDCEGLRYTQFNSTALCSPTRAPVTEQAVRTAKYETQRIASANVTTDAAPCPYRRHRVGVEQKI
jgi:hypothetical protein